MEAGRPGDFWRLLQESERRDGVAAVGVKIKWEGNLSYEYARAPGHTWEEEGRV